MKLFPLSFAFLAALLGCATAADSVVVINEIHYHPPTVGESEWIEIRNLQAVDVNLAGWALTGGVNYTFPQSGVGSSIPGYGYLVIAATPASVPGSLGPFTGSLNNKGDTVRIRNVNGRIMDEVAYDDAGDWPVAADGAGATLSRKKAGAESGLGAWAASALLGGTPGGQNFPEPLQQTWSTPIPFLSTWKYDASGADLGTAWKDVSFDDTAWGTAPGAFSFGEGTLYQDAPAAATSNGSWSMERWTGDADSQISTAKTYTHKVDLGKTGTATSINGVAFDPQATTAIRAGTNWSLTNYGATYTTNTTAAINSMTLNSGSYFLLREFYYSSVATATETVQLTGLTPGQTNVLTLYTVGWDTREFRKVRVNTSNNNLTTTLDQGPWGKGKGVLFKYTYLVPSSGTLTVTLTGINNASWHNYAFSNEVTSTALPLETAVIPTGASDISSEVALRSGVNTMNGSALDPFGDHGTTPNGTMWQTTGTVVAPNDPLPAQITYDLGFSQTIHGMRVWNYNELLNPTATVTDYTTYGAKNVEVLVSPDATGNTFTSAGSYVVNQAYGVTNEIGQHIQFTAPQANVRRVQLVISTNWGGAGDQTGLAEVRFLKPSVANPPPVPLLEAIPSLYATGVNNAGVPTAYNVTDPHWNFSATTQALQAYTPTLPLPGTMALGNPAIVSSPHPAWMAADGISNFIGFSGTGTDAVPFGQFTFSTTFDLSNYIASSASINAYIAVDNVLDFFKLNGTAQATIAAAGFNSYLGPYAVYGPFNAGQNTLDAVWTNSGTALGAGALRIRWDAKAQRKPGLVLAANPTTTYFRKKFTLSGNPTSRYLAYLQYGADDAAVFYLNGQEVQRTNITGAVSYNTPADTAAVYPRQSNLLPLPQALLNPAGDNVLAVEIHQFPSGTNDAYFDAKLQILEMPDSTRPTPAITFSEIPGAAAAGFFVELKNATNTTISTAGWVLKNDLGQSVALPVQTVAPGALFTLNAAALTGVTHADGTKLFLVNGSTMGDSRLVTARDRGLLDNGVWGHPTTKTPGAANVATVLQDVVINELFYGGMDNSPEQWIELYNKGAVEADISGWKFSDGVSYQFAANTRIPAGGYLVLAWNPTAFHVLHPAVTALGPWNGSLSSSGELITLRDQNDNIADQLTYFDSGRWDSGADAQGGSLELKDPSADNAAPEAWEASDESLATPWQTITYSGTGREATTSTGYTYYNELVLGLLDDGEVLIDDLTVTEVNTALSINRQIIQNGTFSGGTADKWRNVGTHKFSTVVDDPLSPGNKVLKIVAYGATEHMHNHCCTTVKDGASYIALNSASTYTISFRAKWLKGTNRLLSRLYLNRLPQQSLLTRPVTGGTPGLVNSRRVANIGPTFGKPMVNPVVPAILQPATVSIPASDPNGIATVQLFTSINGAAFTAANTSLSADGKNWQVDVPGQASGALVQFYFRGTDSLGAVSTFGNNWRMMIPWEDGRTQLQMTSGARPHNLRMVLPSAEANDLYLLENVQSNYYRPCTFIVDDLEAYYGASVRIKSSEHGRFQANRFGYNIAFNTDELFLGAHSTISIDRSGNATTEGLDGTSITSQREVLIKQVMNSVGGVYSVEDDLVRLIPSVATGTPTPAYNGSSGLGEAILSKTRFDDEYLDNQWDKGGKGPLFKQEYIYPLTGTIDPVTRAVTPVVAGGSLTAISENQKVPQTGGSPGPGGIAVQAYIPAATDNPSYSIDPKENYRWHWLIRNARAADDFSGIVSTLNAVGQTAGSPAFKSLTESTLDVDTWLRSAVIPQLFGLTDNFLGVGSTHNFILYFPPGQKGVPIPWDSDFLAQSVANQTASITNGGLINKFIADGANKRRYYCHVLDILNKSFNDTFLTKWATHYSRFGVDDPTTSLPFLRARATYVRNLITGQGGQTAPIPVIPFTRTTASPVTVSSPFTTIVGDGWIDIESIRLQGSTASLALTWTDDNSWSVQLPLKNGTNTYVLEAVTKTGVVVGTNTLTVIASGGPFPAARGDVIASEIMYNPPGSSDDTEFLEIQNITASSIDMGGCHFDDNGQGIDFVFPANSILPPGGRTLIVRNPVAFAAAHPGAGPIAGTYTGALDNGGEEIVLFAANGTELFRFAYSDNDGATDGIGYSLVRVMGTTPNPDNYTWRASTQAGGNPGSTDTLLFSGDPMADVDQDGFTALLEYAFGTSDNAANPTTDFLTPNGTDAPLFSPLSNADAVILTLEWSDDLLLWTAPPLDARGFWRVRATLR